jgi:hypothetical protein
MVPSQALRGNSVTVLRDGKRTTEQVQTGVVGDTDTQILGGLRAGDQVIVTSTTATLGAASRGSGNSGAAGGFGGGGFRGLAGGGGGGFGPRIQFRAGG